MLDLLAAARATSSASRRALYLQHALDEERHGRIFSARARELDADAGHVTDADYDALYERLGEIGFLAYVHRGERRGKAQFEAHRDHVVDRDRTLFEAILVDEDRHQAYTRTLLVELTGSEARARAALRSAALREALWGWRRIGRTIAGLMFTAGTSLLFLALAPLHLVYRRHRAGGWIAAPAPTIEKQ